MIDHHRDQSFEGHLAFPPETTLGFPRVADSIARIRRPRVIGGCGHELAVVEPGVSESDLAELPDGVSDS